MWKEGAVAGGWRKEELSLLPGSSTNFKATYIVGRIRVSLEDEFNSYYLNLQNIQHTNILTEK